MLLEAVATDVLTALEELVDGLDVAVDAREIERVFRLRERLLAKTMEPLRAFDEMMLYQLSKASSTAQFLERCAGLSPAEAKASAILARKLKAMPLTEAAWLAGTLTSGQVRAIAAQVTRPLADQYQEHEAEILAIIVSLDAKDTDLAMQKMGQPCAGFDDDPKSHRVRTRSSAAKPPIRCGGAAQLVR